jgi:chaperonin cofactor prefoldin
MLRPFSLPIVALLLTIPACAQTTDSSAPPPASKPQDAPALTEAKKNKKVLTNEDLSKTNGKISVVGEAKEQPKPPAPTTATPQYVAALRKQLEKLGRQLEDVNKQITDLKNFNAGEPSTRASGVQLDKSYEREPIEVQIRALEDKKKDLKSKIEALYDEARKKGVEPGDLR